MDSLVQTNFYDEPDLYFYNLQRQAPKPVPVLNDFHSFNLTAHIPDHYGLVFHGVLNRVEADNLVRKFGQGAYLVRESNRQREDLVKDGLICFYCEKYGKREIEKMTMRKNNSTKSELLFAGKVELDDASETRLSKSNSNTPRKSEISSEAKPVIVRRSAMDLRGDLDGIFQAVEPIKSKHGFKVTTFFGPHWCAVCNNYMWGLVSQGVKCSKCGMSIHKICVDQVGHYCRPERSLIKAIVGCDLTVLCMAFKTHVCFVITICIKEIELREGDQIQGIYRIGGGSSDVMKITEEFERNQDKAKIDSVQYPDIHTLTNFLKKYLRALPIPIIGFEQYEEMVTTFRDLKHLTVEEKVERLVTAVQKLNVYHLANLETIIRHLYKVSRQSHANKMTSFNLGTIFGQCLFRPENDDLKNPMKSPNSLIDMPYQNECVSFLIEHCKSVFH
ncbi:beta-chimaerin-like isoform X2 [Symsagittifera roscoffensis]|uniref:beta-chimaerin-like isoform X2 n=1 Tax=Symsagittifera roscoffensis TaxID=84072 RepID=UPI00307C8E2C